MFFDTETNGLITEDGTIPELHCICIFDKESNEMHSFYDKDGGNMSETLVGSAAELLINAHRQNKVVYGFNSTQFDLRVMHHHAPVGLKLDIANLTIEHTDLIADFAARKGYFTSLASLTQSFGEYKLLDAVESINLWRSGNLARVVEYCAQDCKLLSMVQEHIDMYGRYQRITKASGKVQFVPVDGYKPWPVANALIQAERADTSWMTDPPDVGGLADWAIDILTKP